MRCVFRMLFTKVAEKYPEDENAHLKYIAVSGFLFLRLFAPAILSPLLFGMTDGWTEGGGVRKLDLCILFYCVLVSTSYRPLSRDDISNIVLKRRFVYHK